MYVVELAGEDDRFAAAELGNAAADVHVVAPGIATAETVDRTAFRHLAFSHRVSSLLARSDGSVAAARTALEEISIDLTGSVAVRARDVRGITGVDTQAVEVELGNVLSAAGLDVDLDNPDHELVALFTEETCYLGWTEAASVRDFGSRAPTDRPFFQPGSMDPMLARAVVNLAGVHEGDWVLDPMCGTGGLLLEAGLVGGRPVGFDAQPRMVAGTRENLETSLENPGYLGIADATALPIRTASLDAVIFDTPYGRQSKIATHSLETLIEGALQEANRVADRGAVVSDRDITEAAEHVGWQVRDVYERRVHRSLVRFFHVLR